MSAAPDLNTLKKTLTEKDTASGAAALMHQIGGLHYKKLSIQPVEFIHANGIGYFEGNVIKYVSRWRDKGGLEDLEKARHYLDLLIEFENDDRNAEFRSETEERATAA